MEYIMLALLIIHLILVIFFSVFLFRNEAMPSHRKAFWFFIFLSTPVFGWILYRNSEGRVKFKKPLLQQERLM